MSHQILQYQPGQLACLTLVVKNAAGLLSDGYEAATVDRIIFPSGSLAAGFPVLMTKVSAGIYQYKFTLPHGAVSVGSYVAVLGYQDPDTAVQKNEVVEIVVSAPFGSFSASPG